MPQDSFKVFAPAKVNLYLGVHAAKDERGYHRVDSVMSAVGLADELAVVPAEALSVTCVPAADFPPEQNTVWRAAVAMSKAFGREPNFAFTIKKHIPIRAGLGGPSTDAAAAILALCRAWGIDPRDERVEAIARGIGADVPFFLYGPPAYFSGAGDVMEETFESLSDADVVLVRAPSEGVTAAAAYRHFDASPQPVPAIEPVLDALRAGDPRAVAACVANNLAAAAREIAPEIDDVLAWLSAQPGVLVAEVSGSGSCCFAVCEDAKTAQRIANAACDQRGWWSCATKMEMCEANRFDC